MFFSLTTDFGTTVYDRKVSLYHTDKHITYAEER